MTPPTTEEPKELLRQIAISGNIHTLKQLRELLNQGKDIEFLKAWQKRQLKKYREQQVTEEGSSTPLPSENSGLAQTSTAPSEPIDSLDTIRDYFLKAIAMHNQAGDFTKEDLLIADQYTQAIKDLFSRESSKREAEIRIDELKLYTNSINETGGGFNPIQYEKNRQQDLEKTDNILGSKIVIDTHMEKMGKVASTIGKLSEAQDSYKDRLTQLLDRFRIQWEIEGDEYHQSELEDDIIRLFIDSIGVFEVSKGDGSQQDRLTNERNSIRDSIMEKWGIYDD